MQNLVIEKIIGLIGNLKAQKITSQIMKNVRVIMKIANYCRTIDVTSNIFLFMHQIMWSSA